MQPTETQVERSLAALRASRTEVDRSGEPRGSAEIARMDLPDGLIERLTAEPAVRSDRLEEAKHRLDASELPDADALATKLVGRLVCDRLR